MNVVNLAVVAFVLCCLTEVNSIPLSSRRASMRELFLKTAAHAHQKQANYVEVAQYHPDDVACMYGQAGTRFVDTVGEPSGTIGPPMGEDGNTEEDVKCNWAFMLPPGQAAILWFNRFDVTVS